MSEESFIPVRLEDVDSDGGSSRSAYILTLFRKMVIRINSVISICPTLNGSNE